jgi:hypothetical protein
VRARPRELGRTVRRLAALVLSLLGAASLVAAQAARPTPRPTPPPKRKEGPPRVFTNDDLEAARKRPSNVQDLSATSGTTDSGYAAGASRAPEAPTPVPTPAPPSAEEEQRQQIAAAEERVKALDQRAKEILWQYLRSDDTNEILALKAEQKQVMDELESAKAELARLRGEQPSGTPTPEPTPIPG